MPLLRRFGRMALRSPVGLIMMGCLAIVASPEATALQYQRVALELPSVAISFRGPIVVGDFERLDAFLKATPGTDRVISVIVDSPGGNIFEAEKIAEVIKKAKLSIVIPSGSECDSACFLLFAAAARRLVAPDALVGVHSVSDDKGEDSLSAMGFTTALARDAAGYGVPPAIIGKMVQTEPGRIAWLTPSDLALMGVETLPQAAPEAQPLAAPAAQPPMTQPGEATAANTFYLVQVGSKQNQTEALATFADMQQKYPRLLAHYRPLVQKADFGAKGVWYRLRIGPIPDKETATRLCVQLTPEDF